MPTEKTPLYNKGKLIITIDDTNNIQNVLNHTEYKVNKVMIKNYKYEKFANLQENDFDKICPIIIYFALSNDILDLQTILSKIKTKREILIGNFLNNDGTYTQLQGITKTDNHKIFVFINYETFYNNLSEVTDIKPLDDKKHYQIGKSKDIIKEFIETVAPEKEPVFITGETGVGKEYVAQQIHMSSKRTGLFVPINCAAITETLAEAELFGHIIGAYSGATKKRDGLIKSAKEGTVFFDEFGELPLSIQAKLLRAIEENEIKPVGADQFETVTDVRYIVATNREIYKDINNKLFRKDLFYRLNILPLHLPPLRDIKDDICDLVNHFIYLHNRQNPQNQVDEIPENSNIIEILKEYEWPGNIRQLRNIIKRAIIFKKKDALDTSLCSKGGNNTGEALNNSLFGGDGNDTSSNGAGDDVLEDNASISGSGSLVLNTADIKKSLAKENENESVSDTDPIKRSLSGNIDFKSLTINELKLLRDNLSDVLNLRCYHEEGGFRPAATFLDVDRGSLSSKLKILTKENINNLLNIYSNYKDADIKIIIAALGK